MRGGENFRNIKKQGGGGEKKKKSKHANADAVKRGPVGLQEAKGEIGKRKEEAGDRGRKREGSRAHLAAGARKAQLAKVRGGHE